MEIASVVFGKEEGDRFAKVVRSGVSVEQYRQAKDTASSGGSRMGADASFADSLLKEIRQPE